MLTFKGWKLKSGEVVREILIDDQMCRPEQHEANKLRSVMNIKGRMTPQYDRS